MKYIVGLLMMLFVGWYSYTIGVSAGSLKESQRASAILAVMQTAKRIEVYNSGYRAGRLEATSELIECDGVDDERVKKQNDTMAEIMVRLGELDTSPYPCEE